MSSEIIYRNKKHLKNLSNLTLNGKNKLNIENPEFGDSGFKSIYSSLKYFTGMDKLYIYSRKHYLIKQVLV